MENNEAARELATFWFDFTGHIVNNYLTWEKKGGLKKLDVLPVRAVVRGYLFGERLEEYRETGKVLGVKLKEGIPGEKLPEPIYTPMIKGEEYVSYEQSFDVIEKDFPERGRLYASMIRDYSMGIYRKCAALATGKGFLIADARFDFAIDENANLLLTGLPLTSGTATIWELLPYEIGGAKEKMDDEEILERLK